MKKTEPQTIEGVRKKKELFMRLLTMAQKQVKGYEQVVKDCDKLTARIIEKNKRKKKRRLRFFSAFLVLVCLCLALGGCQASWSTGVSASAYYPKKYDPSESRRQFTQPTVDIGRNNELPMVGRDD